MYGASSDASGYFVTRFYADSDGVSSWTSTHSSYIGGFILETSASPTLNPTARPTPYPTPYPSPKPTPKVISMLRGVISDI